MFRIRNAPFHKFHLLSQGGVAGSDFPSISPVMTWLISMYYERKEENMIRHRKFASMQYSKVFNTNLQDKFFGAQFSQIKWDSRTPASRVSHSDHQPKKEEFQVLTDTI